LTGKVVEEEDEEVILESLNERAFQTTGQRLQEKIQSGLNNK
jgi:hypothetical protein